MIKAIVMLFAFCTVLVAQVPREAAEAVAKFQQAIVSGDVHLLASIAHFPIRSNEFPTINNEAELKKLLPKIFPPDRKTGLVGQVPVARPKGFVSVFSKQENDPIQFLFQQFGKVYLWCSIDNVNE